VLSFDTPANPTVTTQAATNITATGADLNASALPNGATVTAATGYFRFSTVDPVTCNDTFGTRAPTSSGTNLGAGSSAVTYSVNLTSTGGTGTQGPFTGSGSNGGS